jgi:hypothetical protein
VGYNAPGRVVKYNLDGTVSADPFYTDGTAVSSVMYSVVNQLIFINTSVGLKVVRKDGSQRQDMGPFFMHQILEDTSNGSIIGIGNPGSGTLIHYIEPSNSGTQEFDGALENGVPPTYSDDSDNCLTSDQIVSLIETVQIDCCDCCQSSADITRDINTVPVILDPPTEYSVMSVYYGNSASPGPMSDMNILALSTVNRSSFTGIYNYPAAAGTYKYFVYPSAWGTPSRFKDLIGGFDVVMAAPYEVTVNGIPCQVYRSFNMLGGAQSMEVQA